MDGEKMNETTRRNTNNEINTRIVKVIDRGICFAHTDWGRKRRLKGRRRMILLLTLMGGKWHFVFTRRPCEQSSASPVTSEKRLLSNIFLSFWAATFHSDTRIKACRSFLNVVCSYWFLSQKNVFSIAALPRFRIYPPTTWSEYMETILNR